jgi:hypothetical protein
MSSVLSEITWYRGDSYPFPIKFYTFDENGDKVPLPLTDKSFILTVDSKKSPTDGTTQMFSILGQVDDPDSGVVNFTPSEDDTDFPAGTYFYEIKMMYGSNYTRTLKKDKWKQIQDLI